MTAARMTDFLQAGRWHARCDACDWETRGPYRSTVVGRWLEHTEACHLTVTDTADSPEDDT
jgi:hypothetical protein